MHAFSQIVHFNLPTIIDLPSKLKHLSNKPSIEVLTNILKAVKKNSPFNIQIKEAFLVNDTFHALSSAINKTYTYFISPQASPFNSSQIYSIKPETFKHLATKLKELNALAQLLIGEQDFKSFQNTGTLIKTTIREVFKASWTYKTQKPSTEPLQLLGPPSEYLEFNITGNGFLKQMVRNIVGCQLHLIQKSQSPLKEFQTIIRARNLQKIFTPAPPQGLYLKQIKYPSSLDKFSLKI